MIRKCTLADISNIHAIINDAATAYKGIIPADQWKEPYLPLDYLLSEIDNGVTFFGWDENGELQGVMGIQDVEDVTLIRHAYVRTSERQKGIGGKLLSHLKSLAQKPILIGTWKVASWAIQFYEKNGFRLCPYEEGQILLKKYWKNITDRHREVSIVLVEN